jgi:hypothetical protein
MIVMEGAQADQICSMARELDPSRFRQPLDRHLQLQPLDLSFRNPCHSALPQKTCQAGNDSFARLLTMMYITSLL